MTMTKLWRMIAMMLIGALVLTACGGGETPDVTDSEAPTGDDAAEDTEEPADDADEPADDATDDTADAGASDAVISTYIGQPESLTPTNNTESEGNAVLEALYTTLVDFEPGTNELVFANAESIESEDNQTFVVTLKDGWTFHDGSPVTAQSYVDSWNYAAYGPNAQSTSGFFGQIAGFEDVQCGTTTQANAETGEDEEVADCDAAPPASETLSGLTVDSDTQFTIELTEPIAFFVSQLAYEAFAPLAPSFYDDPAAFDRAPVGNGPFMMDGEWEDDVAINTVAFADYQGEDAAQIGGIEFRIYADVTTAVTDLIAGNLDIVDAVPPEQWEDTIAQVPNHDLSPSSSINYLGFPNYAPPFDNPDLRAALSMAIDREAITEGIFDGLRQPANNILSPVIPGYVEEPCVEWTYNPEEAAARFEAFGGVDALGDSLSVWFNEGGGHDLWMDAVITQWEQNLGIPASSVEFQQLPFAEYLELADTQQFTGPFRLGWGADYLHPQNYLQILLELTADEGGNNATFWKNEAYSEKIAEALAITDVNESLPTWEEAAVIACEEAPLAPMFYGQNTYAWNDGVGGVYVDAQGNLDYAALTAS